MKKSLSIVLFMMVFIFAKSAYAKDLLLVKSTIQDENRFINLVLELDDSTSDIKAMRIEEIEHGKVQDTDRYQVSGPTNFVLYKESGRDVINLVSDNFANHQGGEVILDFLYNGITKSRGEIVLDLSRKGDTWNLYSNGKAVKKLHIVKNKKMLVGVIGIKYINVN